MSEDQNTKNTNDNVGIRRKRRMSERSEAPEAPSPRLSVSKRRHGQKPPKKEQKKGISLKTGCGLGCSGVFLIFVIVTVCMFVHMLTLFSHAREGILNTDMLKGREEFQTTVVIEEGASLKTFSEKLHEAGIAESPFFFRWKAKTEKVAADFKYGEFELSNYMTFDEVAAKLSNSADDYKKFTVIEGQSIFDIADTLEVMGICTSEEFLDVCDNGEFDYDFIKDIPDRKNRLEGYLFPDTYFIYPDAGPWDIANMMLDNFNNKVAEGLYQQIKESSYSLDEIVIISSIIEKEIRLDSERPIAASVINNRLEQGMKLQMDATVLYAGQEHKGRVFYSDTEIESEYNTYYIDGLPIGPIGNAGLKSYEGALNPADTDYIYYVVANTDTGEHYFTDDYNDFLRAKNEYISGF